LARLTLLAALACAAVTLLPAPARAEQAELFGPSIQSVGLAGSGTALADGAASASFNAAAMGLTETDLFRIHYLGGKIHLEEVEGVRWRDGRDEVMPSVSIQPNALTVDFTKVLGHWLRAGVHVNFPIPYIYYLETKDPWAPYSMRWENRTGRGMGTAALSFRLPVRGVPKQVGAEHALQGGIWLGFAVQLRPKGIIKVDLDIHGLEAEGDDNPEVSATLNDVDLASKYVWRPQLSFLLDFGTFHRRLEGLRFGFAWEPQSRTDISPIQLDVEVLELENVDGLFSLVEVIQAEVWLGLTDFWDPHQFRFSLALDRPRFAVTADVQINLWSQIVPSLGRVVDGENGEQGRLVIEWANGESDSYPAIGGRSLDQDQFRDTVDVALGAELRPPGKTLPGHSGLLALAIRMGFRWNQGVARPVDGPSGLMDSDTFTGAVGLGLSVPFKEGGAIKGPFTVDWGLQVIRITAFDLPKTGQAMAGLSVPVEYTSDARWPGGWVVVSGASVGIAF
jgi:hypothetical protein